MLHDHARSMADARTDVLIISTDATIGSLLSVLLELNGLRVCFYEGGPLSSAVERCRPLAAIADCDHSAACEPAAIAELRAHGVRPILFSPKRLDAEVRERAEAEGVPWFVLPMRHAELGALVRRTIGDAGPVAAA